jgi:carboxymethylenebutenolidase
MTSSDAPLERVRLSFDGGELDAAMAWPTDATGPAPGVVVLHDITGLRADTERHCRNFAAAGYVAIAPDLYGGFRVGCVIRTVAAMVSGAVPPAIDACRSHLADHPDVDGSRIGITGFCMGGGFALLAAAGGAYAVAGPFYGTVPRRPGPLEGLCPTIAQAGRQDLLFASAARRLEQHLEALGVPGEVHVHEGVGHSFMNDHPELGLLWRIQRYGPLRAFHDARTEQAAWSLLLDFFARHV